MEAWELSQKFDGHKTAYLAAAQKVVGIELGDD